MGEGGHEVLPATDLKKKEGTFRRHTSVKLWVPQFHSEFSDLDAKYYP
jgi:hypothetical protein